VKDATILNHLQENGLSAVLAGSSKGRKISQQLRRKKKLLGEMSQATLAITSSLHSILESGAGPTKTVKPKAGRGK
jgi:hypothetical protein